MGFDCFWRSVSARRSALPDSAPARLDGEARLSELLAGDSGGLFLTGEGIKRTTRDPENAREASGTGPDNIPSYGHNNCIDTTTLLLSSSTTVVGERPIGGVHGHTGHHSSAGPPASADHLHHTAARCCSAIRPTAARQFLVPSPCLDRECCTGDTGTAGEWATGFKCQPILPQPDTAPILALSSDQHVLPTNTPSPRVWIKLDRRG